MATKKKHYCQNCGKRWRLAELKDIKELHQRVDSGEPMPSGECPACGALCQPVRFLAPEGGHKHE